MGSVHLKNYDLIDSSISFLINDNFTIFKMQCTQLHINYKKTCRQTIVGMIHSGNIPLVF